MKDLISILMPVKNAGLFLEECISSIQDQSIDNWELLAVNDHSTDETWDILQDFTQSDKRIHICLNQGNGIIQALQTAYENSSGSFITRMDADDIMFAEKLETLYLNCKTHGHGSLAIGGVEYFSDGELGAGYKKYAEWLNQLTRTGANFQSIYKECVIPSPCWMMSKKDLDRIDAFSSNLYPEDYDLCFRMYKAKMKVGACDKILHRWRDHSGRSSRNMEEYADNSFLHLKVFHFLDIDYDSEKSIVIWGAGKKGKKAARHLQDHSISFCWVSDNQNKIGRDIYGVTIQSASSLNDDLQYQFIILVANTIEQKEILSHSIIQNNETFLFC